MLEIFDMEQGSPEWHQCRMGIPTASRFHDVMAKGKTAGAVSLTRYKYMRELAGEVFTGTPDVDGYTNAHMERGKAQEDEARKLYCFTREQEIRRVGFIKYTTGAAVTGCSPDGLIGEHGMVEFKSSLRHIIIEHAKMDRPPPEHLKQCQGSLWITGRRWIDLVLYCPGMPLLVFTIKRDEQMIAEISKEVVRFTEDLDELVGYLRRYFDRAGSPLVETLKASLEAEQGEPQA